jgi:hypothetical protein
MKPVSTLLHRTPWWALLGGGLVLFVCLAIFATPFHLINLERTARTPEERRAIKSEINSTFSESAIDVARSVVREMRDSTRDPAQRAELEQALQQIEEARQAVREAGADAARAQSDATRETAERMKEAARAIEDAQREAERAMKSVPGPEAEKAAKALRESLEAARRAREENETAARDAGRTRPQRRQGKSAAATPPLPPLPGQVGPAPGEVGPSAGEVGPSPGEAGPDLGKLSPGIQLPPLTPEAKKDIRKKVTGDLYRIGIGAGLILIFIPLFVLAIVSKFFIDRSRAATALAETKKKEADYHQMSRQVTEAKLSALQAQVEPHFLYNTLASVQALTEVDPSKANEMTGHLIQYLRNALPKMRESVSTVGQEIELVRAYLNILKMRMGKRLEFTIDVPLELMDAPFPPLMLPSLVENAIKHGLEPQREGGTVAIRAERLDGRLRMIVEDTGRGFGDTPGSGVGLTNIRERLAALYGGAAKLTLEAREPHGVTATIEMPMDAREVRPEARPFAPSPSPQAQPQPAMAQTRTQRTIAAIGTAERAWRKGLSFTFVVLVVIAAVIAGLGMVGVMTGLLPVHIGSETVQGPTAALVGAAGIAAAFAVVVLALAIVLAVVYGLGFLFAGLLIFIPLVILVSLFPVLAPFILLGLAIWWLIRRNQRKAAEAKENAPA